MIIRKSLCILLCFVLLTGCGLSTAEETGLPEASFVTQPTTEVVTEPTTQPTAVPTTVPETEPVLSAQPGYYVLESGMSEGVFLEEEDIAWAKMYLYLGTDGTGVISVMGQGLDITWDDASLILEGAEAPYSLGEGTLFLQEDADAFVFRYIGQELPPEYLPVIPVGFYAVSSVSRDGDLSFYGAIDPANGYIRIREDYSGELFFDGEIREFTADETFLSFGSEQVPYQYMTVEQTGDTDPMLLVAFYEETVTTIIFRPAEDPENT